jgi:hypothetical protein
VTFPAAKHRPQHFFFFLPISRSEPAHVKTRAPYCKPNRDLTRAVLRTLARVKSKIIDSHKRVWFWKSWKKVQKEQNFFFSFFNFLNFFFFFFLYFGSVRLTGTLCFERASKFSSCNPRGTHLPHLVLLSLPFSSLFLPRNNGADKFTIQRLSLS